MGTKRELLAKLEEKETGAYNSQVTSKEAIFVGPNFGLTYLVTRLRDFQPYTNYQVPDSPEEFEFVVKGVVRLEMMADPGYRDYRRLLGSVFTRRNKSREKYIWRSRAAVKAFASLDALQAFLDADPLIHWPESQPLVFPADLPEGEEWWLLWQVNDVVTDGGRRFADILADFFRGQSDTLALVARQDVLQPV